MVGVLGVGIVGLIAVLALCGNSSAKIYEPAGAVTNFRVMYVCVPASSRLVH